MAHLEQHGILNKFQYCFRLSYSQLISLVEEVQQALDHHHQIDLVMLDFSKAFDKVPNQSLLQFYGIKGNNLNWIKTWVSEICK